MKPYLQDADFTLWNGDALEVLRELPDESVHMCVTSPPFFGLRDYGTGTWEAPSQFGHYSTPRDGTTNREEYWRGRLDREESQSLPEGLSPGPGSSATGGTPSESDWTTCDHLQQVGGTGASTLGAASGGNDMSDEARERSTKRSFVPYKDVCGKCGATRVDGQIGLESTPEEWCAKLVEVFREVRRVLRKDGTLWLEIGDSYKSTAPGTVNTPDKIAGGGAGQRERLRPLLPGLKSKDLIGQPWMLAFALRADGWYLRSDIIWARPNPMPESVTDRPTKSHSYVFLLTKSPRYYFDSEAIRETFSENTHSRGNGVGPKQEAEAKGGTKHAGRNNSDFGYAILGNLDNNKRPPQTETLDDSEGEAPRGPDGRRATAVKQGDNSLQHRDGERWPNSGRNSRSVWTIATEPLKEEHYAAFPTELVRRCIAAGTSERGCCLECGTPWVREIERERLLDGEPGPAGGWEQDEAGRLGAQGVGHWRFSTRTTDLGWRPSCECWAPRRYIGGGDFADPERSNPIPCTVLDPFGGSGTTALVARRMNRRAILIELSERYCELTARRTQQLSLEAGAA